MEAPGLVGVAGNASQMGAFRSAQNRIRVGIASIAAAILLDIAE
jgi:hypothetical protein